MKSIYKKRFWSTRESGYVCQRYSRDRDLDGKVETGMGIIFPKTLHKLRMTRIRTRRKTFAEKPTTNPTHTWSQARNKTRAILVGDESCHHCSIPALNNHLASLYSYICVVSGCHIHSKVLYFRPLVLVMEQHFESSSLVAKRPIILVGLYIYY